MYKYIVICILCSICSFSLYADSFSLEDIETLHLYDHRLAIQVLNEIDPNTLSEDDKEYHQFLQSLLSVYDGDALYSYEKLNNVYKNAQSLRVQVRSLISLIVQSIYVGHWLQGFEMSNHLKELLNQVDDKKLILKSYQAMLLFYINADQFDIARSIASELKALGSLDSNDECISQTLYMQLDIVQNTTQVSHQRYEKVRQQCSNTDLTYYVALIDNNYFHSLVINGRNEEALILASKIEQNINRIDVVYLKLTFNAHLSELYFNLGLYDKSETAARFVINTLERREYLPSRIQALQVLINLMKQRKDFQQALKYAEMLFDVRRDLQDHRVVKEVAFHKTNLQLAMKENQIALLDKKNQLLRSQTALANERRQTTMVVLLLIGVLLLFVLIWSLRTRHLQLKFQQLAQTDSLTGIANRGYFIHTAKQTLQRHHNTVTPCCLILIDLDCFKQINDTYGHVVGDWAVCKSVEAIKSCIAKGTLFARMGGEEFAILVSYCDVERGKIIADVCRKAIENIDTRVSGSQFNLTASFGISDTTQVGYSLDNLLAASDLALYQSKHYGRNTVYIYENKLVESA